MAGAHVVIRSEGRDVPERTLIQAAELAARHSAAREERSVHVDHTLRKNVRRPRGGKPGQVIYRGEKTLVVRQAE
jgi:predicted ribosome quality control (RQC) complex YloA/Tae2 family protein